MMLLLQVIIINIHIVLQSCIIEAAKKKVRQSVGFFVHSDHDVLMKCIGGSDNYPAITAK